MNNSILISYSRFLTRYIFIMVLVFSLTSSFAYSQVWEQLSPLPAPDRIQQIYFFDSNLGFVTTTVGIILRTSDGGASWTQIYGGHPNEIFGIYFTDANTGYACGNKAWILKTTNGGLTWTDLSYNISSSECYNSIAFSNANNGCVVGNGGVIYGTTNAGVNWIAQSSGVTFSLNKILFLGSNTFIVIGDDVMILRTTNAGTNWGQVDGHLSYNKIDVHSADNTAIYVGAANGYVCKSTDAGLSWTYSSTGVTANNINTIFFISATTGYIGDVAGGIWKTINGGTSWTPQTSGVTNTFYGIFFINANQGFIGGSGGSMLITTNGGTNWSNLKKGIINPILGAWFTDINTGYCANSGASGIYKTTDGGVNWTTVNSTVGSTGNYDLMFIGNNGFGCSSTAGYATTFIKTTDAGANWSELNIFGTTGIDYPRGIFFPTTSVGYIVGDNSPATSSSIGKTTDGGASWTRPKSDFTHLEACYFLDASNGYVAGKSGYIAKTTNGGSNWTQQTTSITSDLYSIVFYNSSIGLACGAGGKVLKTTNGGTNWSDISIGTTTKILYKIKFVEQNKYLTCGANGAIYYSYNGGTSWIDESINTLYTFNNAAVSGIRGWILGTNGAIFRNLSVLRSPEINVKGNGNTINSGNVSASTLDHTDFGTVNIAGGTLIRTFTIENSGAVPLTLGANAVSVSGSQAAEFTITSQPASIVAAGGTTTFNISFDPSDVGTRITTVNINNDDETENPYTFLIQGTGTVISFSDGSSFIQGITPGSTSQVIGRFQLTAGSSGINLTAASIKLNGTRTGLSNFILWSSSDAVYGSDSQLGSTIAVDPGEGNSVSYSFSSSIGTNMYYFLTVDVAADATGTLQGELVTGSSLTLSSGTVTINNALLSGSTAPLPVVIAAFTSIQKGEKIELTWSTATEVNNYGFSIERKGELDSRETRDWKEIGFVKGSGNSSSVKEYSFKDNLDLTFYPNLNLSYRLKQINNDGTFKYTNTIEVKVLLIKKEFSVQQNYPNPFNPSTIISFNLPKEEKVEVKIFDVLGSEVITLLDEVKAAGLNSVTWDGDDNNHRAVPSGFYLYNVKTNNQSVTKKMILVR